MTTKEPTKQQLALAEFADSCEESGVLTSLYYRLYERIVDARAAIAKAKEQ